MLPDNYGRWAAYDNEKEVKLMRRPKCCACGNHIQEETAIHYLDDWYCEDCEDDFFEEMKKTYTERIDEE